jgi:hypothetical protein
MERRTVFGRRPQHGATRDQNSKCRQQRPWNPRTHSQYLSLTIEHRTVTADPDTAPIVRPRRGVMWVICGGGWALPDGY